MPLHFLTMLKRHKDRSKTEPIPFNREHDDSKKIKHRVSCNPCLKQYLSPDFFKTRGLVEVGAGIHSRNSLTVPVLSRRKVSS